MASSATSPRTRLASGPDDVADLTSKANEEARLDMDGSKASPEDQERLEALRVDDSTLNTGTYEDLSLYEKKSVAINRELDAMNAHGKFGLGRYQWFIFFLCGFGFFLDLCWAQAFGLIAGPIQQELGVSNSDISSLFSVFAAGLTVGAFFWGLAADVVGRKWCFNLTCLISSIFGLVFAAPSNFSALVALAFFNGVGIGGNIPLDCLITLEFLPTNRRFLLALLSTFQPIGVVFSSLVAYGLVPKYSCDVELPSCSTGEVPCCQKGDNMGWRYVMIVLGCITLLIFVLRFVVFRFQESPKFLLSKGHDQQAIDVLYSIAAFNKAPSPSLTIEDFRLLDRYYGEGEVGVVNSQALAKKSWKNLLGNFSHLKGLFATKRMIWLTLLLWLAYMSLFWSFSIAGGFLPLILRAKGISTSADLDTTYRNYVWVYLPGTVATIIAAGLMEIPRLGRRWAMVVSAGLMGMSLFLFATASSFTSYTVLNGLEYFMQSMYAALLYAATPELFPAPYRGSASGIASTLGRLASTVAPKAAGAIFSPESNSVLYMAGAGALLSMLCVGALPFDTRGKQAL